MADEEADSKGGRSLRETVTVVLLSVTAVLTAWSGFEASKWGGEMSIAFSRASTQRIEASTERSHADAAREIDLQVFALYLQGVAEENDLLADFASERFTPHFRPAFDEWLASRPLQNPDAAPSPFALDSYVPPGEVEAVEADARADALFEQALANNQRGDNYTLVTVLFALVLFFGAFAGRFRSDRAEWGMVGMACLLFVVGVGFLLAFPKIV
ncbi:hypothetical protein JN535_11370 [Cellulosimicrobium cellulans]|uniref:hypothetical protein n=1 Tax=Cellulosimicrobium cellulans TaxID=1710 RepID=UPI00196493FC|nr:hypothetical protein [Cellulosimicrobium cellulans]MBN0040763.1 hypothetical protein [Cellulosimicrobium cellulans]